MTKKLTLPTLALFCAALLAQPALAASDVANIRVDASSLSIQPLSSHDGMTLRVQNAEGEVFEWSFDAGADAIIFASELSDGGYTYEAIMTPRLDASTRREMQVAREQGRDISRSLRAQGRLPAEPQVTSGFFTVRDGAIVTDLIEEFEGTVPSDSSGIGVVLDSAVGEATGGLDNSVGAAQVFVQDVVIQGSNCVGIDCVSSESFGFDTIRLKENNLRLKFQDTSASASFPSNDWQLTANDSSNGGAEKFSIDDITSGRTPFTIRGGSIANALYVDAAGDVGLGTNNPVVKLHLAEGDTPTLRLEQNGASGFTPQTWDLAGNETNFFIRDVTNGSKLSFRIKPGTPENTLFLRENGNVGMGTASPDSSLHVRGTAEDTHVHIQEASGVAAIRTLMTLENNGGTRLEFVDNSLTRTWAYRAAGNNFVISTDQSGVNDMLLRGNAAGASLEVAGSVTAGADLVATGSITAGTDLVATGAITGASLTVTGSITSNGMVLMVPDYVFEADYPLMSLDDLSAFLAENKHLPAVPSAAQIKANGLDHSRFQMNLLQKVEELTLYTLDQHTTINTLSAENEELKSRLEAIEAALGVTAQ